jgi:hypothetical protein
MPAYEINPNNAGTIELALAGITPLVAYSCQITQWNVIPSQNLTTTPGTYCQAPHDTPGLSSWAVQVDFLQDWGNTPSLSAFSVTNDGELCDFEFTSSNPTAVPSVTGQMYITATSFGGAPGEVWTAGQQTWPMKGVPTVVPDA